MREGGDGGHLQSQMTSTIEIAGIEYRFDSGRPIDISIPLRFNGPQPNAYGVEPAASSACEVGDFIGDTRRGGSVNFEQYTIIPHCSGTHTECVGHITHERISVRDCLTDVFIPAILVSVAPSRTNFSLSPAAASADLVITEDALYNSIGPTDLSLLDMVLIVRTLPNDDSKMSRLYGDEIPPYFSHDAMEYIVDRGVKHLLVDMPSIDRIYDDGNLTNHRLFWKVEPDSFETNEKTRVNSTITELIYVPNEIEDGEYLLNLQIAPFQSDASPSRPVLFKIG